MQTVNRFYEIPLIFDCNSAGHRTSGCQGGEAATGQKTRGYVVSEQTAQSISVLSHNLEIEGVAVAKLLLARLVLEERAC